MEYTNDVIFNIEYSEKNNELYFKENKWKSKVKKFLKENKMLNALMILSAFFITVDCVMIISFFKILKQL